MAKREVVNPAATKRSIINQENFAEAAQQRVRTLEGKRLDRQGVHSLNNLYLPHLCYMLLGDASYFQRLFNSSAY